MHLILVLFIRKKKCLQEQTQVTTYIMLGVLFRYSVIIVYIHAAM